MTKKNIPAALLLIAAMACAVLTSGCGSSGGAIVIATAAATHEDPFIAGKTAAAALKRAMGDEAPKLVLLAECFDEEALKRRVVEGVASVLGKDVIVGAATYGSFTQAGPLELDSVSLMGIGGDGVNVATAVETNMGAAGLSLETHEAELRKALGGAGRRLAKKLSRRPDEKLLLLIADAHSPKNALLIEGVQEVLGKDFPITGGSVCKNAGETFVYYRGDMHADSAVAVMLSGDFTVSLAGRQAKTNDRVIASAKEAAAEARGKLKAKPIAALAFDCAGRKGKLENLADELAAMQSEIGHEIPLYGSYCAGEFGPSDTGEKVPGVLSSGRGWHVMFTLIGAP